MTGLELLLALYLGSWIGSSSTMIAQQCVPGPKIMSRGECITLHLAVGIAWPYGVYQAVKHSDEVAQ